MEARCPKCGFTYAFEKDHCNHCGYDKEIDAELKKNEGAHNHYFSTSIEWGLWKLISSMFSAIRSILVVLIFFLITIGFFTLIFSYSISSNEIVSYPITERHELTLALNRTIYKVSPSDQTITYWMSDFKNLPPDKLINCVVRDKKNWIGYYPDDSGSVQMSEGRIVSDDSDIEYVGKLHWWLIHLGIIE